MLLETIPNTAPQLTTRVKLAFPFAGLCPVSGEPQPGSTLSISYEAGNVLLETKALRRYLETFAGDNQHGVRDLEQAVQRIAQECANALTVAVTVAAHYILTIGEMDVEVRAQPYSSKVA